MTHTCCHCRRQQSITLAIAIVVGLLCGAASFGALVDQVERAVGRKVEERFRMRGMR